MYLSSLASLLINLQALPHFHTVMDCAGDMKERAYYTLMKRLSRCVAASYTV